MDEILAKASNQAVTFAIRSGISLASGFAIKTVTKLLDKIPESQKKNLLNKKAKLQTKITILSTSIDLIRLAATRGNSALDATVGLVNDLKEEIDQFDVELYDILSGLSNSNEKEMVKIAEAKISALLDSINEAIPLISLALVTSGVNLPTALDPKISPSRLLQASNQICKSNSDFDSGSTSEFGQVGPVFDLTFYSVFYNPSRLKYVEDNQPTSAGDSDETEFLSSAITWKEEFARCSCVLERTSKKSFDYELVISEDFDDGRYHEDDTQPQVKRFKLNSIKKQFFSASGKLLKLEGSNSPVLTLKIQTNSGTEYVALGETSSDFAGDSDEESDESSKVDHKSSKSEKYNYLSLLEYLIRLASLQEVEQKSILDVKDEMLLLYLHNQTDNAVVPKSNLEKHKDHLKEDSQGQMLSIDSNVNRLKHLSLQDESKSTA